MYNTDVVIIGAGAAGLMCAIEAARRGRSVIVIDHASKPAEKIRISGGGKCNFTHLKTTAKNFLSQNPKFALSALKRFTPQDFLARVEERGIPWFEKTEGQLFCEESAKDIIDMLLDDLRAFGGTMRLRTKVNEIEKFEDQFLLRTPTGDISCEKVVIATGGLSIPKMGATNFAYETAKRFGHNIIKPQAGLVPFVLENEQLDRIEGLSGVALDVRVSIGKTSFDDGFLITHRGLSGPAILQISSYWQPGTAVTIDLCPEVNIIEGLKTKRTNQPKQSIHNTLAEVLPRRLSDRILDWVDIHPDTKCADLSNARIESLGNAINRWTFVPDGTEGYRTAEVTVGGIDTNELSSQTMESRLCEGLYFIGECVDVTGWLGGYNFQWAWSSGWACGQAV